MSRSPNEILSVPGSPAGDILTGLLRGGARRLLARAVEDRRLREAAMPTVIDEITRECSAIDVARRPTGRRPGAALGPAHTWRCAAALPPVRRPRHSAIPAHRR